METTNKRITLPDEEPEIFSSILEYLYKGDYYPRLIQNKRRNTWELETGEGAGGFESTIHHHSIDGDVLKDTVIYCTAEKYGLDELKRVALRKQGLRKYPYISFMTSTNSIINKNPAFNAAPSCRRHDMRTPTLLRVIRSCELITSLSSFEVEALSNEVVLCNLR
jgi:hypothetical protein